jgi:ankyrin repeat protein
LLINRDDSGRTAFHYAASKNHHLIMGSIATYFSLVLDAADKDGVSNENTKNNATIN